MIKGLEIICDVIDEESEKKIIEELDKQNGQMHYQEEHNIMDMNITTKMEMSIKKPQNFQNVFDIFPIFLKIQIL